MRQPRVLLFIFLVETHIAGHTHAETVLGAFGILSLFVEAGDTFVGLPFVLLEGAVIVLLYGGCLFGLPADDEGSLSFASTATAHHQLYPFGIGSLSPCIRIFFIADIFVFALFVQSGVGSCLGTQIICWLGHQTSPLFVLFVLTIAVGDIFEEHRVLWRLHTDIILQNDKLTGHIFLSFDLAGVITVVRDRRQCFFVSQS